MVLSIQELNLALEYKTRAGAQGLKEWYEEVVAYIDAGQPMRQSWLWKEPGWKDLRRYWRAFTKNNTW